MWDPIEVYDLYIEQQKRERRERWHKALHFAFRHLTIPLLVGVVAAVVSHSLLFGLWLMFPTIFGVEAAHILAGK